MQDANGTHTPEGKQLGGCTGRGFMPGHSGNPAGRPRGSGITERLRRIMEQDDGELAEIVAQAVVKAARRGDIRFVRLIFDRLDGPVAKVHHPADQVVYVKSIPQADIDGAI